MHQYLIDHGYWSYVDGANDATHDVTHRDPLAWEQAASKKMYYFTSNVKDQLLSHTQDAKMPKKTWTNLKKVFATSTTARKVQLRQEKCPAKRHVSGRLHSPHQGDLRLPCLDQCERRGE